MQNIPLESKIQTDIIKWLKSRPKTFTYKHEPTPKGIPDIHHIEQGLSFWFEVKRTQSDKPKKMQKLRKKQLRDAGALSYVVRSLDEVKKIIRKKIKH